MLSYFEFGISMSLEVLPDGDYNIIITMFGRHYKVQGERTPNRVAFFCRCLVPSAQ